MSRDALAAATAHIDGRNPMPELDPRWEYATPDPEIEYILATNAARGPRSSVSIEFNRDERTGSVEGFRFGRGSPDATYCHMAPRRRGREDGDVRSEALLYHRRCAGCNSYYLPRTVRQRCCSRRCASTGRRRVRIRDCGYCGREFTANTKTHRFCSRSCRWRGLPQCQRRLPPTVACARCGVVFRPENGRRKYCSLKCVVHLGGPKVLPTARACAGCGHNFKPDRASRTCCSNACRLRCLHAGLRQAREVTT